MAIALLGLFFPFIAYAGTIQVDATAAGKIHMLSGKSIILKSDIALKRVSVADPEVADFTLLSPPRFILPGKPPGPRT